jgi:CheY-like chemotaxis protein
VRRRRSDLAKRGRASWTAVAHAPGTGAQLNRSDAQSMTLDMADVVKSFYGDAFARTGSPQDAAERAPRRKPRVMCVDDDPQMLESLRDMLRRHFDVVLSTNGFEALRLLTEKPFDVVLSDMQMPMINGARFLTLARAHAPDTVRLLLTGQSSVDAAIAAVNEGEIFRFLIKPCPSGDLVEALTAAVDRYVVLRRDRELHEASLEGTVRALVAIAESIDPASRRRGDAVQKLAMELAERVDGVPRVWELQRACELTQLGIVGLPPDLRSDLAAGRRLVAREAAQLERLPELAARFLLPIASLNAVAAVLTGAAEPLVPTRHGVAGTPRTARVLRIALDFQVLIGQGVPTETALGALRARDGRYDTELLATFTDVVGMRP